MRIIVEVKDSKVDLLMSLLNDLPYVKATLINNAKDNPLLDEIREAVADINLIKAGKLKASPVEELFNEL